MIPVPDSVAFYWGDAVNRAAINVLGGSVEVPGDLTLSEAERFELANLAVRRVRVEYWRMLRMLWSASWERAVQEHLPSTRLLTYGVQRAFCDDIDSLADPSVESAWEQRAISGVFDCRGHGRLFTRVGLVEGEREGELRFYLISQDGNCTITDRLELGANWSDDGDSRRATRSGLLPVLRDAQQLDPAPFASLAFTAAAALAAALS